MLRPDRGVVDELTGHAKMQDQMRCPIELKPEVLAAPMDGANAAARHGASKPSWRQSGHHHVIQDGGRTRYGTVDQKSRGLAAVAFNERKFGHGANCRSSSCGMT